MTGFGISGGAFYLRGQAMAVYLANKTKPAEVFIGTSAGAIIAFVSAVLGVEKMWQFAAAINPKQALKSVPFTESGELKTAALFRFALGYAPVKQSIIPILNTLITDEQFAMWAQNKQRIEAFCTTCNIETGKRHVWQLSKMDKQQAILTVEASARMQGLCEPVLLSDGCLHWDGGQKDHNPAFLLPQFAAVSELVAIWSRPQFWGPETQNFNNAGSFKKLMRMIEIDNVEKSLNDEQALVQTCKDKDIKLHQVYIDRVLRHHYDYSEESQRKAVQSALQGVKNAGLFSG